MHVSLRAKLCRRHRAPIPPRVVPGRALWHAARRCSFRTAVGAPHDVGEHRLPGWARVAPPGRVELSVTSVRVCGLDAIGVPKGAHEALRSTHLLLREVVAVTLEFDADRAGVHAVASDGALRAVP